MYLVMNRSGVLMRVRADPWPCLALTFGLVLGFCLQGMAQEGSPEVPKIIISVPAESHPLYPEPPRSSRMSRLVRGSMSGHGDIARGAANGFADAALAYEIRRTTNQIEPTALEILASTGQRGVLVEYEIERFDYPGEISRAQLISGHARVVGAGTTSDAVRWADFQRPYIGTGLKDGAVRDSRSFSIWYSWNQNGEIVSRTVSDQERYSAIRTRQYDERMRLAAERDEYHSALSDATKQLERVARDIEETNRLSAVRAQINSDREKLRAIDQRLEAELSRQRRLSVASQVLQIMQGILTVAGAVNTWMNQSGEPPGVDMQKAKTTAEVSEAAAAAARTQDARAERVLAERNAATVKVRQSEQVLIQDIRKLPGGDSIPQLNLRLP